MIDFERINKDNNTVVIRVDGNLDETTTNYMFECVKDELETNVRNVVLNLANVGYVSSVGLGELVRAKSRATKVGGTIYLCDINSPVLEVLSLVSFDKLFNIYPTEVEVMEAIAAKAATA
jgi:stage II sporulation protein AA (anti-sigma F factor antagonist)